MIILGIDPGTARIGFAIVKKSRVKVESLEYGC
jgi:Holliday junction resolvasome RuvABC endonuclease subunit